jgi:hypothetical protein
MANVKVQLNLRAINRLMAGDTMQRVVDDHGQAMARRAGPNFEYVQRRHKWTARGYVQPANAAGAREQRDNAVLERVIR